jgi:hypothetical protein
MRNRRNPLPVVRICTPETRREMAHLHPGAPPPVRKGNRQSPALLVTVGPPRRDR